MKLFRLFKVLIGIALLTTLASAGWAHNQNAEHPRTNSSSAGAALDALTIKGRAAKTGYDRDAFKYRESDPYDAGCEARNATLRRDLTNVTTGRDKCLVNTGTLDDPYSGKTITFKRGRSTSNAVQVDHVVALSDAWQKGAQKWDADKLARFGNDPLNLLAVDGTLNTKKGDSDAATWLPPNKAYRCEYVARQIAVKQAYDLSVTKAEHAAMKDVLKSCPEQILPER